MERREIEAEIAVVISNVAEAQGLEKARSLRLPTVSIPHRLEPSRAAHEEKVLSALDHADADWVCLAGYMRLLSAAFVDRYPQRILNIHPALLPAFPGVDAQRQAVDWGAKISGCTVHLVDAELDHGPIVMQKAVSVHDDDNAISLSARILAEEHKVYPEALRRLISDRWRIEGRRVVFS
jgi:phosphoribosylglycinamide formyltransferase-1